MSNHRPAASGGTIASEQWTAERANKALPLVRRIVEDLVMQYRRWTALIEKFEVASLRSTPDNPDAQAEVLAKEVQQAARAIQGFVAELTSLGVECKGYEQGLVDFPGRHEGASVHFCWQRGETTVAHWHPRDSGFAGRQPL